MLTAYSIACSLPLSIVSSIVSSMRHNDTDKVRENRLRRMAFRQGYRLLKSRARDPRDITFEGYQLVNIEGGGCVCGYGNANRGYAADLKEIEAFLTNGGQP